MKSPVILDSNLFIPIGAEYAPTVNAALANDKSKGAHLVNQLLLFDSIVIPTRDFGVVQALIRWFGLETFEYLIDSKSLLFQRRGEALGIAGGLGLVSYRVGPAQGTSFQTWQVAAWGPTDEAIDAQLAMVDGGLSRTYRRSLGRLIRKRSTTLDLTSNFDHFIKEETLADLKSEPHLAERMKVMAPNDPGDLTSIPEVRSDQVKLGFASVPNDVAEIALAVAESNLDLFCAYAAGSADVLVRQQFKDLLDSKIKRSLYTRVPEEGLTTTFDLLDIPNVGKAVMDGEIEFGSILKERSSKNGQEFRAWIREIGPESSRDIERKYVQEIVKKSISATIPVKCLRFVIPATLGLISPPLGIAASASDSFIVDRLMKGYSPSFFLDSIRRLFSN